MLTSGISVTICTISTRRPGGSRNKRRRRSSLAESGKGKAQRRIRGNSCRHLTSRSGFKRVTLKTTVEKRRKQMLSGKKKRITATIILSNSKINLPKLSIKK